MYKIAVIGGRETVVGFKALGLDAFPVADEKQALEVFKSIAGNEEKYAIIYLEEGYSASLSPEIDKYKDSATPAVILIPGKDGSLGLGLSALKAAVERAVGSDIL